MPDTFLLTILFILACTFLTAFVKGRSRDRCLAGFSGYPVRMEKKDGETVNGVLEVSNSGLEVVYAAGGGPVDGKNSYILYKKEYDNILYFARYRDELSPVLLRRREQELKRTCSPTFFSRFARRTRNFFGTVRDALLDITGLVIGRAKTSVPAGRVLQGQDKYTSQIQSQFVSTVGTSYEPILEKYIGKRVLAENAGGGGHPEYRGILKDYSTEFIELLDVDQTGGDDVPVRACDVMIPRSSWSVRYTIVMG